MNLRPLRLSEYGLRHELRLKSGFAVRFVLLAILCLVALMTIENVRSGRFLGPALLTVLAWVNFLVIGLLGASSLAATVAEEQESRTLGLLQLAGFRPWAILLGKSIGTLVGLGTLFLVQAPFFLLCFVLGGVSMQQVGNIGVVLSCHLFAVYGIASFASVRRRSVAKASRLAVSLTLGFLFLPYLLRILLISLLELSPPAFLSWIHGASGLPAMWILTSATGSFTYQPPGDLIIWHLVVGALGIFGALRGFERAAQEAPERNLVDAVPKLSSRSSRPVQGDPLRWHQFHFVYGGFLGIGVRVALIILLSALFSVNSPSGRIGEPLFFICFFGLWLDILMQTEGLFRHDLRRKTWGAITGLPISLGSLVWARVRALLQISAPFSIGALLGYWISDSWLRIDMEEVFSFHTLCLVSNYALALAGTAFISAGQKGGGAVLCALLVGLGNMFLAMLLNFAGVMRRGEELFLFLSTTGALVLAWLLVSRTRDRLRAAAAQE